MGKYQFKNIKDEKTKDSWRVEGQYYPATRYEPAEYPEVIIESDYSGNEIQDEKRIYSVDDKENFGDLDDILKNEFELVKDKAELEKACETLDDIEVDEVEDYDIYKCKNVVFTNDNIRYEKGSYFTLEDIENMFSYDTTKLVQDYYDEWKNKDYSDYYEDSKPLLVDSKQVNDLSEIEIYNHHKENFGKKITNEIYNKMDLDVPFDHQTAPDEFLFYINVDGKPLKSFTGKILVFEGEEKAKEYAKKKNLTNYKIDLVPFKGWIPNAKLVDSKQVNDNVINLLNQLQSSLKGAYNLASGLKQQLPQQQPTTNEEKTLYNGKVITSLENIADSVARWYKEIEEYKKEFAKAHIVIEEIIESFPLEARTKLRESENPDQTYKELVEDLKNRYNSLPEKEKYKEQVIKMKKDLDGFYKNTFKK